MCVCLLWCSIYHVLAYYIIYILLIFDDISGVTTCNGNWTCSCWIKPVQTGGVWTFHCHWQIGRQYAAWNCHSLPKPFLSRMASRALPLYDACEMVDRYLGGKYLKSIGQYLEGKHVSTTFPTGFPWSSMGCLGFIWTLRNTKTSVFPAEICSEQGNLFFFTSCDGYSNSKQKCLNKWW